MDLQEQTIRPIPKKVEKQVEPTKSHQRNKSSTNKAVLAGSSAQNKSPSKSHFGSKFELPPRPDLLYREQSVEDYSDLFDENDNIFDQRLNQAVLKVCFLIIVGRSLLSFFQGVRQGDTPQLFHPSDLTSLPRSMQAPSGGSFKKKAVSRPSVLPDRPMRRTRSSIEIQKFAEDDDEDFSDVFGPSETLTEKEESERGSEDGGLMLLSKISSNSWLGDDEDEDDPFASMDPGWDEMDLEANIARDRYARLTEKVEDLVRLLKTNEGEDALTDIAEELVSTVKNLGDTVANTEQLGLLWEHTEVKNLIISAHGLLPILEILEPCTVTSKQYMILQLLKVVNAVRSHQDCCSVGLRN